MKQCPRCSTSYGDDVATCPLDGAALSGAPRGDPLIGRTIKGRYRIVSRLGDGGMGTVYRAEQLSVGRTVALKVLHREFTRDEEFVQRFHQEARLAAALNHPRLTTVFDFDQSEDGSLFIVMEYLEGTRLSDLIQRSSPLEIARAVRLAIQVGEGIEAAHAAGVIHRDIKPQNIMVLASGDDVKLMDFGIARLNDGRDVQLTRAGTMMGTPLYMAPEQIEGRAVGEKTDIYAFGVVLYEMLSGQTPFSAPTSAAVLAKQLNEPPRPLRAARPDVPPVLERIVMQALDKDPEYRQERVAEVVRGLRTVAGTPARAPDETQVSARTIVSGSGRPPTYDDLGNETMIGTPAREPLSTMTGVVAPAPENARESRWARLRLGHGKAIVIAATVLIVVVAVAVAWSMIGRMETGKAGKAGKAKETEKAGKVDAPPPPPPRVRLFALKSGMGNGTITVTGNPPASDCGPDCFEFDRGASVTLTATADRGSRFDGWSRPGCPEASCTASLTEATRITATFLPNRRPDPGRPPDDRNRLTSKPPLTPEAIKASVKQALSVAKLLRDPPDSVEPGVDVVSVGGDGVVTLRGVLRNDAEKQKARDVAQNVTGVKTVVDVEVNVRWN